MKNFSLRIAIASVALVAAPAFAGGAFTYCESVEQRLSSSATEFLKISASPSAKVSGRSAPSEVYRQTTSNQVRLQNTADRIWDLRAEMVNRGCAKASTFTY